MASPANEYKYDYFNITFPKEYVALVEINRPEKLNAFVEEMWLNMKIIFDRLSIDPDVRCVVLTGAGERAFTAGLDVKSASESGILASSSSKSDVARTANHIRRYIHTFQSCITSISACEKPVLAILHGISYGLALDISLAADIRLCAANTSFSVKEVDIGLAADIGTLSRLPHANLPSSWYKEVALTARVFGAEEAMRVGLVNRVFGSREEAVRGGVEMAGTIAAKSPVAVVGTKEVLDFSREHGVLDGLNYVAVWNAAFLQTEDVGRALEGTLKKKKARFAKL
ncbi:enoyl-CoA hydratase/isomerase family protein [Delphinella strobiligena]|nr:enoyl-CoA hydratase/isomerase family protein [Delphinella strobiligena]